MVSKIYQAKSSMKKIRVKTPAKINLVLEILGKRPDGFHELQSIMQAVSLFDYLGITVREGEPPSITLSGNCPLIPYNGENIAYKAVEAFLKKTCLKNRVISIHIRKNIPVAAGLAGGSSNAAGVLWGLNMLYGEPLSLQELHFLASTLGSDVNFCLQGGTCSATSRGEVISSLTTPDLKVVVAKPKNLFISAKDAYQKYSALIEKPEVGFFEKMKTALAGNNPQEIASLLENDLEKAVIPAYPEVAKTKQALIDSGCINAVMSGSGPSVFGIYTDEVDIAHLKNDYEVFKVKTVDYGVNQV